MDTEFPESPPKRRRTNSPEESTMQEQPTSTASADGGFLDVLMQQVEAQTEAAAARDDSTSATQAPSTTQSVNVNDAAVKDAGTSNNTNHDNVTQAHPESVDLQQPKVNDDPVSSHNAIATDQVVDGKIDSELEERDKGEAIDTQVNQKTSIQETALEAEAMQVDTVQEQQETSSSSQSQAAPQLVHNADQPLPVEISEIPGLTSLPQTMEGNRFPTEEAQTAKTFQLDRPLPSTIPSEATNGDQPPTSIQEREWETDSSPIESSSDSDSSDLSSSDDSEDEVDGDYDMMNAEEQARILMQDEGASDDEGKSKPTSNAQLRTANEKTEEVIPKPDIEVTPQMTIEQLGKVEAIVESTVVVKATISGEYQVLESGSLLCLQDRTVVGVVSETLGRVEQPLYTIRFTNNDAIEEAGLSQTGTIVYYVVSHSTFVFTQPLKGIKGSDASNFHDEEVGDDEMEFSDDEKEAEHKRLLKMKRKGVRDDGGRGGRGGRGNRGGMRQTNGFPHDRRPSLNGDSQPNHNIPGAETLNYDDDAQTEYNPLPRPYNLHEMMSNISPIEGANGNHHFPPPPPPPQYHHQGHKRGRGNDRGNFRGRGRNRGGSNSDRRQNSYPPPNNFQNSYGQQQQSMPPPQIPYQQHQPYQPPHAPYLPPQQNPFSPFSPSPISPLPQGHFDFNQQQGYPSYPQMPPPPGQNAYGYSPQPNYQQQYGQSSPTDWHNTQAAQQVQRQLEEMRRSQGQGQ